MMKKAKFQINLILTQILCLQSPIRCALLPLVYMNTYVFDLFKKFLNIAPPVTTDQSSKIPYSQRSSQSEATIDGHRLRWPKFGVKNALFKGNYETTRLLSVYNILLYKVNHTPSRLHVLLIQHCLLYILCIGLILILLQNLTMQQKDHPIPRSSKLFV